MRRSWPIVGGVAACVGGALGALLGASSASPPDAAVNRLTAREIRLIDERGLAVLTMRVEDGSAVVTVADADGTERRFVSEIVTPAPASEGILEAGTETGEPEPAPAAVAIPPREGWEQAANWDELVLHSSKDAVEKLLGLPRDVRKTSSGETWVYGPGANGRGRVYFDSGNRVTGWYEPRSGAEGEH